MIKLINFENQHTTVLGTTQTGKTTAVMKSLEKQDKGVLFFNPQQIPMPKTYVKATGENNVEQIIRAIRSGKKVNFVPDRDIRWKQFTYLVNALYKASERAKLDMYFVGDEIHLARMHDREANNAAIEIATTGLTWGIKGIWISQRPAEMEYTLLTQSTLFIFFTTEWEGQYLKQKGIPFADIEKRIQDGQYSFCTYHRKVLDGPFRVM